MEIHTRISIPKGEFPDDMSKEEISLYIKGLMAKSIGRYVRQILNEDLSILAQNNTSNVFLDSIFITSKGVFYDKVQKLLDDPAMSKKDFFSELVKLIKE